MGYSVSSSSAQLKTCTIIYFIRLIRRSEKKTHDNSIPVIKDLDSSPRCTAAKYTKRGLFSAPLIN